MILDFLFRKQTAERILTTAQLAEYLDLKPAEVEALREQGIV